MHFAYFWELYVQLNENFIATSLWNVRRIPKKFLVSVDKHLFLKTVESVYFLEKKSTSSLKSKIVAFFAGARKIYNKIKFSIFCSYNFFNLKILRIHLLLKT